MKNQLKFQLIANNVRALLLTVAIAFMAIISSAQPTPKPILDAEEAVVKIVYYNNLTGMSIDVGTGFFIDEIGTCITNVHVVEQPKQYSNYELAVMTKEGDILLSDSIIGYNEQADVFVFNVLTNKKQPYLSLAKDMPMKGDMVFIIGHPMDYDWVISRGFINGFVNSSDGINQLLLDVTIMPGSSGSPVLNKEGKVLGIATSVYNSKSSSNSFGLASTSEYFFQLSDYYDAKKTINSFTADFFSDNKCKGFGADISGKNIGYSPKPDYNSYDKYFDNIDYLGQMKIKKALYWNEASFLECADAYYQYGQFELAVYDYLEVLKFNRKNTSALFGLAKAYYQLNDLSLAMNYCNQYLKLSNCEEGLILKSLIYSKKGKHKKAHKISKEILYIEILKTMSERFI